MDHEAFDRITRALGTSKTRRLALGTLLSAPLFATRLVEAREGALDGAKGGRHGPNRRGRNKRKRRRQADRQNEHKSRARSGERICKDIRHACSVFKPDDCCTGLTCMASAILPLTFCQQGCSSNSECAFLLDGECRFDAFDCPFLKCCRPKTCTKASDCPQAGKCGSDGTCG